MGNQVDKKDPNKTEVNLSEAKYHVIGALQTKHLGVLKNEPFVRASNYWFESVPGTGKSSAIGGSSKALENAGMACSFRRINCTNLYEGELSGMPVPQTDEKNRVTEVVKMIVDRHFPIAPVDGDPELGGLTWKEYFDDDLRRTEAVGKKIQKIVTDPKNKYYEYFNSGFIFLDEFSSIQSPTIRQELVTYCDGSKKPSEAWPLMPPAWIAVATGNDSDSLGEESVNFNRQLLERFVKMTIVPQFDDFKDYIINVQNPLFKTKGFHPMVRTYLEEKKDGVLCHKNEDEDQAASPRTWEGVSDKLYAYDDQVETMTLIPEEVRYDQLHRDIKGLIGRELAADFMIFFTEQQNIIKADDILNGKLAKHKEKDRFKGIPIMFKKYSLYNASMNIGKVTGDKIDSKLAEKYLNLIDNATFLFGTVNKDFLSTFICQILADHPDALTLISSKDLSEEAYNAVKESASYLKTLGSKKKK